jgi:hypothetical protein
VKKFEHRKNITRLRISAYQLQRGRYQGRYQGIPKEERQCLRCDSSDIDIEFKKRKQKLSKVFTSLNIGKKPD